MERGAAPCVTVLLDTHAWIWWAAEPERLSDRAATAIAAAGTVLLASISCWEVAMLAAKDRVRFDRPVERWIRQALARPGLAAVPLTPRVATAAGVLPASFPGDPADRMIYATARAEGAELITRDGRLREFDPRGTRW
ncbi:MAG: type II toxin-antitoxin system VapC family toxin [Solirubrobacterales bacterium]|nr:type II toxin-antitoxin system VapC family toxin [Solirubrobacterales bacterium]